MHFETDLLPHQMLRLIQLGAREEVIDSLAIWTCASCETCVSRCPMGVRTPEVIDALRAIAVRERRAAANRPTIFNNAFLASVRRYGRVFEPGMLAAYKLRTGDLLGDARKLPAAVAKGKLRLLPPRGANRASIRRIFRQVRENKK
jgi:heterodisulfide reductase subunit C